MRKRLVNLRVPAAPASSDGPDTEAKDIVIIDGRIAELAPPSARPAEANEERIDLGNQLVVPGAIDGHVHFDDPGFTHRENFETGTRAAAASRSRQWSSCQGTHSNFLRFSSMASACRAYRTA